MNKATKKGLRKTALKLLPAIYDSAMRTGAEEGLFQHEDWRTGICLGAFLLAEAFEDAATYRDAEPEPKLKQLDQSVFDGLDEKWRFAAVNADGFAGLFKDQPYVIKKEWAASCTLHQNLGDNFDTTNWQNSLIERNKVEPTGSDLCRKMLERGDKYVMCSVSMADDETALSAETVTLNRIVISLDKEWLYTDTGTRWHYAVPINNQGEPLTASEAGL